ncbi:MAG: QueT transporter family protein [Lachnospiraceae bacterium]|jgi:uncharacterized membrane protein|nr:QueT transporter family protein [Lachnospiraceae bacterium]
MSKNNKKVTYLAQAAMIASLYVVLTYAAHMAGLASGVIQVRISEALTILPFFTIAAVPGLAIGCVLANFLTGGHWIDIVFGSLASLIGAILTYKIGRKAASRERLRLKDQSDVTNDDGKKAASRLRWLAPLPPIAANAIIVPFILLFAYGLRPLWFSFVTVTIGQVISCGVLGMCLLLALEKRKLRFWNEDGE